MKACRVYIGTGPKRGTASVAGMTEDIAMVNAIRYFETVNGIRWS